MILLSHPTGNVFVRAVLACLQDNGLLYNFHTTLSFKGSDLLVAMAPPALKETLLRREFALPRSKIVVHPAREMIRLLAVNFGLSAFIAHETGWASIDQVYQQLDGSVAEYLMNWAVKGDLSGVYAYEDGALKTFRAAKKLGLNTFYDLPIAYWEVSQRLLKEEAQRLPDWEPTLVGTRDSARKLDSKTEEIYLADAVICSSKFVYDSLPEDIRGQKKCLIAEFGSPEQADLAPRVRKDGPLRILFAGAMSQRKGLADVFEAMNIVYRADIELVVMGSPLVDMDFYRIAYPRFIYEPPRSHREFLKLMRSCDVLVLPSIVEGRALVQQEAMSCGLPIIVTANAGAEDLIIEGKTGFLVPIRSPESIAEKINWFADHVDQLPEMGILAQKKASEVSWGNYQSKIISLIGNRPFIDVH